MPWPGQTSAHVGLDSSLRERLVGKLCNPREGSDSQEGSAVGNEIEPEHLGGLAPAGDTAPIPSPVDPAGGDLDLDLLSASIRADAADTDSFFRVLASKLEDALGDRVHIKLEGGLFKRDRAAVGITVDLATGAGVVLEATRKGSAVECMVNRPVRGIVVSSKPVSLPEWIDSLTRALADEARHSAQTWKALHGMLA
jgi:hypothetical protein